MPAPEEIIYDEAVRAVEQQERSLDELRQRAGVLLGVLVLVTSFFGSHALTGHRSLGWQGVVGLLAALGSAGFILIGVITPSDGWTFACDPLKLLEDHSAHPGEPEQVHRFLAEKRGAYVKQHHDKLQTLYWNMQYAIYLLIVSVGAWLWQIGGG